MSAPAADERVLAVIVNYNGAQMSLAAVESLMEQDGADEVRIVVVDNGSARADVDELEAGLRGRASVLRFDSNRGYPAACNAASLIAAEAGIPYVWWLNNDLSLEPGTLDALVRRLDQSPGTAGVGAVTVDEETGQRVLGAGMALSFWRSRVRHRYVGVDVSSLPKAAYAADVVTGTCFLVRVSALRVIGLMDEGYFMYSEDVDWSMRARAAGYSVEVVPAARARHGGARSSVPQTRLRYMMRARVRLVRARGGLAVQPLFMAYFVLGWLPAYTVARLVPQFGLLEGLRLAIDPLTWNVGDALRRRRWRLRPEDLVIPRI